MRNLVALVLLVLAPSTRAAIVYEASTPNTDVSFTALQVGNQVTLAGTDRTVTQLSVLLTRQGVPGTVDVVARFWSNAAGGTGAPDQLLWESALLDDVPLTGGPEFVDIAVPNITVPDTFTWTVQISDSQGIAAALAGADAPTVGTFVAAWFGNPPPSTQFATTHGARITAIPEPVAAALLAPLAAVALGSRRRA